MSEAGLLSSQPPVPAPSVEPPLKKAKLAPWKNALSGATAGVISRFVISPLDVIKIRFQLQTDLVGLKGRVNASQSKYSGVIQAFGRIIREEGVRGLWKGNLSAEYLYLTYGAVQFYSYYEFETLVKRANASVDNVLPTEMLAGALAGSTATLATYPFDLLRTRFAVQGVDGPYTGLVQAVRQITATEGIRGFYRGVWPSVLQMMPQMGIVFACYGAFKRALDGVQMHGTSNFVSGGLAGMIGKAAVMPFDVVRKRLQIQGPERNSYVTGHMPTYPRGIIACARKIAQAEGPLALYKGLVPAILKAGPSSAVTFMVVGVCERLLR
ncbi:mitochondrial thiamine pyrophosphate transporter [Thoreauomyces humboldtii]|nr:mitochondrial thiamine pyrophosphate transporter [Thoreauomyces humboldtii]